MKILVAPYNLLAHYLRSIALVKNIPNNAEIVFLKSGRYDNFVTANGYKLTQNTLNTYSTVIEKAASFDFSWINKKSVNRTVNELIEIIKTEKPDYIIGDTYLGMKIAAEYCNITLISIFNAYLTHHYNDLRPTPHNHKANKFKSKLSEKSWNTIVRTVEKLTLRKVHSPFRKIRRKLKLKQYRDLFDEFTGDKNILCDDPEIFPSIKLPDNYQYCGPLLYSYNVTNQQLLNFLSKDKTRKTILISMGSTGKITNIGDLKNYFWLNYNIVITGAKEGKQTENIYYTDFINFDETSHLIDLIICHGGNGTMYQAINKNIPAIAIPTIFEQEWNIHRFEKLSLCKVWYAEQDIKNLYTLIESLTSTNTLNPNIIKLQTDLNSIISSIFSKLP
ncbi:MAG: glycosyltransferase [Bacteroidales bacterium]|nr:glycosyltransferase [Bacteroidales bacterium]MDD4216335.1 glycosyltransferase [Bacteroidales bacterium]MDY0140507.1 glycosyltransferase [Bacteroidales bacterium]